MSKRILEHSTGIHRFSWVEGAPHIEIYQEGDGVPTKRIGFLVPERDGTTVPYEPHAFRAHCYWFLQESSDAEVIDETVKYDIQRVSGGKLIRDLTDLNHYVACGIVELIWGTVPESLEDQSEDEWKLHIGGHDWVIIRKVDA